jgi:predicted metal-dependent peptidase
MAIDKMTRARASLVQSQPFFGSLLLRMKPIASTAHKTMATDGKRIFYNPDWVETLSMSQIAGVLAHEVMHIALMHHLRRGARNKKRWNYAADYAINPIVLDAGMELPEGGLVDPAFKGLAAEQIYARLPADPPEQEGGEGDEDGEGGDGDPDLGMGAVLDADLSDGQTVAEAMAEIQVAVAQAANVARAAGNLPAYLAETVEEIKRGRVDWRARLRSFMQTVARENYTWQRPSRRFLAQGVILPTLRSEAMGEMVVAVDTSGSVHHALDMFMSEMSSIAEELRPERLHVIYCDTAVQRVDTLEPEDLPYHPEKIMGGGTFFQPVFNEIAARGIEPAICVYLTDLEPGDVPTDPGYPVLWASVIDQQPPFGDMLHVTTD